MNIKTLLAAAAAVAAMATGASAAADSAYPDRPIRLLVGYAPGGPVDTTARVFAKYLGDKLGQAVVVENRAGASGMIASDATAKAPPDGYLLGFAASPTLTMSPLVQRSTLFDPRKDFSLIGLVVDYANVLLIGPQAPAKSVGELVDYARAHPDAVSFGSAGIGASNHLSAELLKKQAGVPMLHVPYRGNSPAMMDVVSGKITFMFDITSTAIPFIKSGKARALAVTSRTRNPELPDVPTMIEAGMKDYEVVGWYALVGPRKLPDAVQARLKRALSEVSKDPAFRRAMTDGGYTINSGDAAALQQRIDREYALWADVIKSANIQAN
ncbi:Bug family tripartite tricarboxylate transporter substrate binding protein [Achromobacter xylosoxidans]|nr:tripartite tricarboxylate transporter substrate binding protein [Achromobacter xylosoxidans]AUZ20439.1 tripartite tricarboxylate transporter substrate binding protein [Achromobacter xylosoxidans]AXA80166.1 tripartite tricarboxylate transporter substrate binding protein [Achromobacter xylosoxidans]EFV82922.1 secreted protein [Achromobacter xylosoxidans C54]KOQ20325.1 ABC transporter substrate-binding protein [Achromobacter xylosoxidans]KOQ20492.1 ABC transporter substrate-binding protein [Ac